MKNLQIFGSAISQLTPARHVARVEFAIDHDLTPRNAHTLYVVDVSGSMEGALGDVRNDLHVFVAEMGENEFASILIFSGHGKARLIAGPTQTNQTGRALLKAAIDRDVRVLDTTVFSEPLELALQTIRNVTSAGHYVHHAVMLTDGCAVPTCWSVEEEENRALQAAREVGAFGAVLSVIGYGVHYDDRFLVQLMEAANSAGTYRHISEIENLRNAIREMQALFAKTVIAPIDLFFQPDSGTVISAYRHSPEVGLVGKDGRVRLTGAYEGKVALYLELSGPVTSFKITGRAPGFSGNETLPVSGRLTDDQQTEYIRMLAAFAVLQGNTDAAASLLQLTGDDGLADRVGTAYSTREQREAADDLRHAFAGGGKKWIGAGLKPQGPNHSVLNILRILIEDPGCTVYIPQGAYKRSGVLTEDPRVIHPPHGRELEVKGYTSHSKFLNFSMRTLKNVRVLPEDGNGPPVPMHIWRSYNVILDGNLHIPMLQASLSEDAFHQLWQADVIEGDGLYVPNKVYTLDLTKTRLISSAWANPGIIGLADLLREEARLEVLQTALNARAKNLRASGSVISGEPDNIYQEKSAPVPNRTPEYYTARCVEIRLMGYKVDESPVKDEVSGLSLEETITRVKAVRKRLVEVRFVIRACTFAMESVKSFSSIKWGAPKTTTRGKDPKEERLATFGGASLKRVVWTEQVECN